MLNNLYFLYIVIGFITLWFFFAFFKKIMAIVQFIMITVLFITILKESKKYNQVFETVSFIYNYGLSFFNKNNNNSENNSNQGKKT